jgi:hypothetical protein
MHCQNWGWTSEKFSILQSQAFSLCGQTEVNIPASAMHTVSRDVSALFKLTISKFGYSLFLLRDLIPKKLYDL